MPITQPMDVVLITARSRTAAPHWSRGQGEALATAFVAAGRRVRWLCAVDVDEPVPTAPAGVELTPIRGAVPPFRAVQRLVADVPMEVALARVLRPLRAATVVQLGPGAPGPAGALWLADRMGARTIAIARADEVLCHRGTLVDARGQRCTVWSEPSRCVGCCCTPTPDGLTPREARWARRLRALRGWSPFPSRGQFLGRADLLFASLQVATIVVASEVERDLLGQSGLSRRSIRVVGAAGDGSPDAAAIAREPSPQPL